MNTNTPNLEQFAAESLQSAPDQLEAQEVQKQTSDKLAALFEEARQSEQVQAVLASSGLERETLYASLRTDPAKYPVGANRSFDQVS